MREPFVSVVIPVLNDAKRLKVCLEALKKQTYPADSYEVIVVDNASDSMGHGAWGMGYSKLQAPCSMLFLHEPIRGSYKARNTGVKQAKGGIFAFTDADCIPAQDWLKKGVGAILKEPNIGLIAGKIEVFPANPDKPTAAELFELLTAFCQKEYIKRWHFGALANVFTTRELMDKVGPFDGTLKSGADVEWGNRVFKAGYKQVYRDDVCIRHPARCSLAAVLRKERRVAGGLHGIRLKSGKYPVRLFLTDLKDDWPGFKDLRDIFSDKRLNRIADRYKLLAITLCVKAARISERIRLYLGGASAK